MTKTAPHVESETGTVLFVPLNKLKKSSRNARRMAHQPAHIEALAASIAAHGLLQSPVIEAERNDVGKLTGNYLVTIGEGRRLAQVLRAKRKEITKTEPVRCVLESEHDAFEISLAENEVRAAMHPADQFDAFYALHTEQGLSDDDIAARFGVTPAVVKQRLKLASVSPVLMASYREGVLNLDQLMGYAITDDHARQDAVFAQLGVEADREDILNLLNDAHVDAKDRRAVFVGLEAYRAAGAILRDLFDTEHGGYLTDAALLHRLTQEKLAALASEVKQEGWLWIATDCQYDYAVTAGMRRIYPEQCTLSPEDEEKLATLEALYRELEDDESDDALAEATRMEREIDALYGEEAFAPAEIARAGVMVSIGHNGEPRIERGFVRPEDDERRGTKPKMKKTENGIPPLSEKLVAELTAQRSMALREALGGNSEVALIAVVHGLAAQCFFHHADLSCLQIEARQSLLAGTEESDAARKVAARHNNWVRDMPEAPDALWDYVANLDPARRLDLLAHCASLTLNAVERPQTGEGLRRHAVQLARAVDLDMATQWTPTIDNYLGRVPKERILEAVREGYSIEAAENIAGLKKLAMAEAAAQRLQGKGWLPAILRKPMKVDVEVTA